MPGAALGAALFTACLARVARVPGALSTACLARVAERWVQCRAHHIPRLIQISQNRPKGLRDA